MKDELGELRDAAKEALVKAGYGDTEGSYIVEEDGSWRPFSQPNDQRAPQRSTFIWPFFPDIQPLSQEAFARELIFRIDNVKKAAEAGEDVWSVLSMTLFLMDAYYRFQSESGGVADLAFSSQQRRNQLEKGRQRHADKQAEVISVRRQIVRKLADEYWATHARHRGNRNFTAKKIQSEASSLLQEEFGSAALQDLGIGLSTRSIERDLAASE